MGAAKDVLAKNSSLWKAWTRKRWR